MRCVKLGGPALFVKISVTETTVSFWRRSRNTTWAVGLATAKALECAFPACFVTRLA